MSPPSQRRRGLGAGRDLLGRLLSRLEPIAFPPTSDPAQHWQRQVLNDSIAAHLDGLGIESLSGAEISGGFHGGRDWGSYCSLDYPEFDLCAEPVRVGPFDVVLCEQVLEHVAAPWLAARNLRALGKPGASIIVSTPFMIKLHELPQYRMYDYWRFTPRGLRTLLESAGLEVEQVRSWGNRECVIGNLGDWSSYRRWHPLANQPDLPVQVWAFARVPG